MSFFTHLLTAIVAGLLTSLSFGAGLGRDPMIMIGVACGVAALLPDVERFLRKPGKPSELSQRMGMTHSIPFLLIVPWFIGLIGIAGGIQVYLLSVAAAAIGYGAHLLLDVMTPYPVQLFWPAKKRVCLSICFFSDYGLMLAIFMCGFFFANPHVALLVLGVFLTFYLGGRIGCLIYAKKRWPFFKPHLGREKVEEIAYVPDPLQPWVWKMAVKTDEAFHAWDFDLMTNHKERYKVDRRETGLARRARAVELVRLIDEFTPFFALKEHPKQGDETTTKVTGEDLRYHFYGKQNPLRIELIYDADNKLISSKML